MTGTLVAGAFTGSALPRLAEHANGALSEALTVYVVVVGF